MNNTYLSSLQDYQFTINSIFKNIEEKLIEYEKLEESQKIFANNFLLIEFNKVKTNIYFMESEFSQLKDDKNIDYWQKIILGFKNRNKSLNSKLLKMKNAKNIIEQKLDINEEIDKSKLTIQQAFQTADVILNEDKKIIRNLKNVVNIDLNTMKNINSELLIQDEKLTNSEKNIEEIDNSLNRAGTQIKSMFKILAADGMIKCMIFFIILTILAILVISFISDTGGKNMKNDTFKNGE